MPATAKNKSTNPFSRELKRFSVCTPCYGDAWKTFPRFFGALEEQDYKAFEVTVVFDGPNPKGLAALRRQMRLHPRLDIRHAVIGHGGAPKARNEAARLSTGDYLTFLDPDIYPLSETFRQWANAFEANPDIDVVWGLYSFLQGETAYPIPDSVPKDNSGRPDYWAFRYMNFCSGMFPLRREAFVGWDETVKSLQDWDMWQRMLLKDGFEGKRFLYIPKSFCLTDPVREGGISQDSHEHWKERRGYVMEKNGIPRSRICVTSLGAPFHGLHAAKKLGAEYLPMPSFKDHDYEAIYLLGFYPGPSGPTKNHLAVFAAPGRTSVNAQGLPEVLEYTKARKIIHWIGTDALKMRTEVPFVTLKFLRELWEKEGFVHLSEVDYIQEELREIGIESSVVPIPPDRLFEPMPLPERFSVAVYENPTQKLYREDLMLEVARSLPDVQFYFFGDDSKKGLKDRNSEHLGWIDLADWMPRFSCNLRVTVHDGLPLTPLQFMTAARYAVTSTALRGAIKVGPDRKEVVEAVRTAQSYANSYRAKEKSREVAEYWRAELDFKKYKKTMEDLCRQPR